MCLPCIRSGSWSSHSALVAAQANQIVKSRWSMCAIPINAIPRIGNPSVSPSNVPARNIRDMPNFSW